MNYFLILQFVYHLFFFKKFLCSAKSFSLLKLLKYCEQYFLRDLLTVLRESHRKYFLLRVNITEYNVLNDGRNFYDQPINDQIKRCDEIRKTSRCLLDYQFFKSHYRLIAADISK